MNKQTITHRQLYFIIIQTQIGVGILSLPYSLFQTAKIDGWMSLLIAGILIQFSLLAIWKLCERFPNITLFEFQPKILGKYLGFLFNVIYTLHFMFISVLILILYNSTVSKWILFETPRWVVILIMAGTGSYFISSSPREIARFFTLVSPLLLILLIFIIYGYSDVHPLYILPVGEMGIKTILKSSKDAVIALLGYDSALIFMAYTEGSSSKKLKVISFASLCVTILYAFVTFTVYMYFNPIEIIIVPEPVLYMLKAFSFSIIERTDLIFLSVWMISVATSFISYMFLTSKGIQTLFKKKDNKKIAPILAVICTIIAVVPNDKLEISTWNKYISLTSLLLSAIFPVVLLIIAVVRKKAEKGAASS
jgi:spore germination protein (amino acid permease)